MGITCHRPFLSAGEVLYFLLRITVSSANSFIDQGINEGRELTSAVLSAERGMLALQPHE